MADGKGLMKEPAGATDNARSLDMAATTVKIEPQDGEEHLDEVGVYSVKLELEIEPTEVQPPDYSFTLPPCKPEPAGSASTIESDHLIKNEPEAAPAEDISGSVRALSRTQYTCDWCDRSFVHKKNLKYHIITHTGGRPHECDICKKRFSLKSSLNTHMVIHTSGRLKCDICKKIFKRKQNLNEHMLIHKGVRPHKCDVCKKSFTRKFTLNVHMLTHTGVRGYKCNICKKSFSVMTTLTKHLKTHVRHDDQQLLTCHICKNIFKREANLIKHMLTHTDEGQKCDICKRIFFSKSGMKAHMLTHSGEGPHKCDICKKGFSQISYLNHHNTLFHTRELSRLFL